VAAMIVLAGFALVGLAVSLQLPANPHRSADARLAAPAATPGALDTVA